MGLFKAEYPRIRKLRALGGTWTAERVGFGTFEYHGQVHGHRIELRSYAHLTPQHDMDDDTFMVLWHVYVDGEQVRYPTLSPLGMVEDVLQDLASQR